MISDLHEIQRQATVASVTIAGTVAGADSDATVSLRELNTLTRLDKGGSEALITSATVKTPEPLGATSVTIEVDDSGVKNLRGRLPSGLAVTIDSQAHTLASAAQIQSSATSLELVLSSGLTGSISAGDTVSLATHVEYADLPAIKGHEQSDFDDPSRPSTQEIMLPKPLSFTPVQGSEVWSGSEFLGVYEDDAGTDEIAYRFVLEKRRRQ